ncbi:MAG: hydrogenase iron-sulfur subunit [Bacteroidales bacterium]|nr:hydrogenase iron-sulfur subunit [Bacteroidales bacterium]MBN2755692.1 hydrogenase iron-sulfur subunit [Bacteroidales bacterium]
MEDITKPKEAKILVFSTEKISDPAIDLAGLLKMHYPPKVYTINVPCSSAVKPRWVMHAFEKGFDGVFIAADGTDCSYSEKCTDNTSALITLIHTQMKEKGMDPAKLKMAAICSVCAEPFVKHMINFASFLSNIKSN